MTNFIVSIVSDFALCYIFVLRWKQREWSRPAQPQGEVVFGIHPVTLALTAGHRQRLHRLYLDRRHKQAQFSLSQALTHIHSLASEQNVPVEFVHKNVLMYLSDNRPHQVRV